MRFLHSVVVPFTAVGLNQGYGALPISSPARSTCSRSKQPSRASLVMTLASERGRSLFSGV
jgi:hypothetical protein